jgi:hypothetical protein
MVAISDTSATKANSLLSGQEASYFGGALKPVQLIMSSNTGVTDAALVWQRNGTQEYQMYQSAGGSALYLRDLVNARMLATYSSGATDTASNVGFGAQIQALGNTSSFGPTTNAANIGSLGTTDVWFDALSGSSNANVNVKIRAKGTGEIQPQSNLRMGGGAYMFLLRGNTASRPSGMSSTNALEYYDSTILKPVWWSGTDWRDARGYTTLLATKTTSYTHADGDEIVVYNGTSLTATLPDPTTVLVGKRWNVKNINASALTVVSAGTSKTIDGAASQSLAQWAKAEYVSDGTQWLTV